MPIPASDTQYFQDVSRLLGRKLLQALDVEQYIIDSTTPSFYNTTIQAWEILKECRYASRAFVCNISATLIVQNGFEVIYVNTIKSSLLRRRLPSFTTTPAPPEAKISAGAIAGIVIGIVAVIGGTVFFIFNRAPIRRQDAIKKSDAVFAYNNPVVLSYNPHREIPVLSVEGFLQKLC